MTGAAAAFFSDPVICYFLDTFLMLYCLVATALFFREKFSALQAAEPNDEDVYQKLNLERKEDAYEVLNVSSNKKRRGKKKNIENDPQPRDKDLYETLVPRAATATSAV